MAADFDHVDYLQWMAKKRHPHTNPRSPLMFSSFARWLWTRSHGGRNAVVRKRSCKPCLEALEDRLVPTSGLLDPTFDGDGILNPPAFGSAGIAIQTNGKIVTAGTVFSGSTTVDDFAVARYNANGSLDTSFGSGGKVVTDFGKSQSWDRAFAIAIQTDGKIVVAGEHSPKFNSGGNWDMAVVRYNANGSLDTSFGSGGKVTTGFSRTSQDEGGALALQADGKIVVAGWIADDLTNNSNSGFTLARLNSNGTLDTSFGSGGHVRIRLNVGGVNELNNGWPIALATQPDGKMIVSGTSGEQAALVRVNSNGSLDTSFGNAGEVIASLGESSSVVGGLALQQDGRILVAGQGFIHVGGGQGAHAALARFNSNGSL